jgi:hypothetical protein
VQQEEAFPIDDRRAVLALSEDYWPLITRRERETEEALEREMPYYREIGHLDKRLFLKIAEWKSSRPKLFHQSNTEEEIRIATAVAFHASSDKDSIEPLRALAGVALRTATALLHWMRPAHFPILDVRVVDALREQVPKTWESIDYYSRIADRCRRSAEDLHVDLRAFDRALWTWDKRRSKL